MNKTFRKTTLKTSAEWVKDVSYRILDPDGWDRANYDYSFNKEKITFAEFQRRLFSSTIEGKINNRKII
jgi:hypothetical protein